MSPLAGPVAAGAVVFRPDIRITGVDDSKKLDPQTRERLADQIWREALAWSVGFVEVEEIDRINIYQASLLRKAVAAAVPGFAAGLFNSYRPEKHYMRGPGPKTLGMIGRRFRAETRSTTRAPLPEHWLALVHSLEHQERERMQRRTEGDR